MKVALAQIDPVVGAFDANVKKIKEAYQRACAKQARLLLTPELSICGYPPHDLLERPEMIERNETALIELMALTQGQGCALVVGHVAKSTYPDGKPVQNVITVLQDGKRVFRQAKSLLPTYDVFDEARYFEPAHEILAWDCDGKKVAFAICEDLWAHDPSFGRRIYGTDPVDCYRKLKVDYVFSCSASPYFWNKRAVREELHTEAAKNLKVPLVYVNQVGANDEILFDGSSFAVSASGKMLGRLPVFKKSFGVVNLDSGEWELPQEEFREDQAPSEIEILSRALVVGIRDYFARTGFKQAILGLSGGIDSAVVAALACEALGAENVLGVAMPSQYSSIHSLEDAELLARNLKMRFEVKPIKFLFSTASREIAEARGSLNEIALENLQARLRGMTLMTLSNHYNALVLTTGNKSELAMGYCTQYGDMCGAIAPIGDVFKTRVYELANHLNETRGNAIPQRTITKAPSAELRPNQKDQDTLPPYEFLDRLLADYIEHNTSVAELRDRYAAGDATRIDVVNEIFRKLEMNEFKRRQAPPVLKTTTKAFGMGRRYPIAKTWTI